MASRACQRCGYEPRRPKWDAWADRHPAGAVCAGVFVGLPALYTVAGIILAYPWFFVPMLVVVCAVVVDRRMRRRAAIAARADWEHRALIAAPIAPVRPVPQRLAHSLPWQMVKLLRTEPIRHTRH